MSANSFSGIAKSQQIAWYKMEQVLEPMWANGSGPKPDRRGLGSPQATNKAGLKKGQER
jgi:hypothetical protein